MKALFHNILNQFERRKVVLFIILFTLLFLPHIIFAQQEMRFERITPEKGFPGIIVYSILQDYQGFMWFATMSGLIKYDGYKFTTYRYEKSDSGSLRSYDFHSLYEDKSNNLWIGANGVLSRYNREKDNFEHYYLEKEIRQPAQIIHSICEDDSENLYLGAGRYGFYKFNIISKTFTKYESVTVVEPHLRSGWTGSLYRDNNIIWIVSGDGLVKFDIGKQTFENYKHVPGNRKSLSSNNTYCLHDDKSGALWIGTFNGLNKFDKSTGSFEVFGITDDTTGILNKTDVFYVTEPENEKLWLLTSSKGLIIFDKAKSSFYRYNNEPENPFSLSTNFLWYAYKDKSGIVWIGTQFGGLNKYNPEQSKFMYYKHNELDDNSLTDGYVRAMLEDRSGTIWIGTVQGLNQVNIYENKVKRYQEQTGTKNTISDNNISSLCEDSQGNLWVGTMNGLDCLDKQRRNITVYVPNVADTNSLVHNMIAALYEDRHGDLWVGTQGGGIEKYCRGKKSFTHYRLVYGDTNSLSSENINSFYEDKYGDFWVCTWGGLNKFDRNKGIFKAYYYSECGLEPLIVAHEDKKDRFWVVSWQTGLSLFDRVNTRYKISFGLNEGLSSNTATDIKEDDKGNLWVGTVNGLSKYNPEAGKFTNYEVADGLPFSMLWHDAELKDRKGYLYFGGERGFFRFHPDSLEENTIVPSVVLTDFKIFNVSIKPSESGPLKKNINVADEINLKYEENIFSIEFAALDYRNPMKNRYAYMLEGFNTDWVYTDALNRSASYTSIDPGEYIFRVKGSNNESVWNEAGASLRIIITPPFWMTWWFRTLAVLTIAGILGGSVRYVTIQRYRRRLALEKERSRISKDMHDEVGSSLTKISILSELAKQEARDPKLKSDVEKISQSAGEVVDNISEIIWAINPKNDTLDNLLAYIREYAAETLEMKNVNYKIELPDNVPHLAISAEARRNIFLVIKEALNNTVKYAQANFVKVTAEFRNSRLEFTVKDNGVGFDIMNTRMFGNGLTNMKKRMEDIDGEFSLDSKIGSGTEITLSLKLSK